MMTGGFHYGKETYLKDSNTYHGSSPDAWGSQAQPRELAAIADAIRCTKTIPWHPRGTGVPLPESQESVQARLHL